MWRKRWIKIRNLHQFYLMTIRQRRKRTASSTFELKSRIHDYGCDEEGAHVIEEIVTSRSS